MVKWTLLAMLVLLVGTYAMLAYRYYAHDVQVKRNYAAELNEPILKIPEEQRAWTHYRRALMVLEPLSNVVDKDGAVALSPDDEKWSATAEYLKRNGIGLAMLRRATEIRPLGELHRDQYHADDIPWLTRHGILTPREAESLPAASENPPLLNLVRASSEYSYRLGRLLAADAQLAALDRDSNRVVDDLLAMLGMVEQWCDQEMLVDQMIGPTMLSMTAHRCGFILAEQPDLLLDEQLARLSKRLAEFARRGPVQIRLAGERMSFADIVQRIHTDDGHGDGTICLEAMANLEWPSNLALRSKRAVKWSAPITARFFAGRREVTEKYEQYVSSMEKVAALPLWQRANDGGTSGTDDIEEHGARYLLLAIFLPAVGRVSQYAEQVTQERDALMTAIAIVRYHQRHGQWPKSLVQLCPELLAQPPVDRFDGKSLRYRLIEGRPVLYSVGRNLQDDGGKPPDDDGYNMVSGWPPDPTFEGDWVLWPPVKEPRKTDSLEDVSEDEKVDMPRPPEPAEDDVPVEAAASEEPCR